MISYFPNSQIRWPSIEELVASLLLACDVTEESGISLRVLTDGVLPNQLYTIRCANSCENKASEDDIASDKDHAMMAKNSLLRRR